MTLQNILKNIHECIYRKLEKIVKTQSGFRSNFGTYSVIYSEEVFKESMTYQGITINGNYL